MDISKLKIDPSVAEQIKRATEQLKVSDGAIGAAARLSSEIAKITAPVHATDFGVGGLSSSALARAAAGVPSLTATAQLQKTLLGTDTISRLAAGIPSLTAAAAFNDAIYGAKSLSLAAATGSLLQNLDLKRFELPNFGRLTAIAESASAQIGAFYKLPTGSIATSMASLKTPWLDSMNSLGSASAFARLQGIGHLLDVGPVFGRSVSTVLRTSLGDWRDTITMPADLDQYPVRAQLYAERGFDTDLVEFPDEAFEQSISLAGLSLIESQAALDDSDEDHAATVRANRFHAAFTKFEKQFRRFVAEVMTQHYGNGWMLKRLPANMLEDWKRTSARDGDRRPLLEYAEFSHLEQIILKRDNWNEAFAPLFGSRPSLVESFQRLYPARHTAMHSRPLEAVDELYAAVEIHRIRMVILLIE